MVAPAHTTTTRKAQKPPALSKQTAAPKQPAMSQAEVIRACSVLCPHEYTELRALHCSGNIPDLGSCRDAAITGYFDDWRALAHWAGVISPFARGVYIVLNPFTPALLARCYNRVKIGGDVTKDGDVIRRVWLPLDFDPMRPAGVSATDSEKELARAAMRFTCAWLSENLPEVGQPQVVADSGNGYHALYRIDLPPDDGERVKTILAGAASACKEWQGGQARVTLDVGNYNPARIWKLYGTVARKGDDFQGNRLGHAPRPWRDSRILELNGEVSK